MQLLDFLSEFFIQLFQLIALTLFFNGALLRCASRGFNRSFERALRLELVLLGLLLELLHLGVHALLELFQLLRESDFRIAFRFQHLFMLFKCAFSPLSFFMTITAIGSLLAQRLLRVQSAHAPSLSDILHLHVHAPQMIEKREWFHAKTHTHRIIDAFDQRTRILTDRTVIR